MAPEPRYLKLVIFEKMFDNCFGFALSQKNRIRKAYLLSWYLLHVSIQDLQVSAYAIQLGNIHLVCNGGPFLIPFY